MRHPGTVLTALVVAGGGLLAGCGFSPSPAPAPDSCAGTAVEGTIRNAFAGTGAEGHALQVAWRESRCNPGAIGAGGAIGLFQLVGHGDLLWAVCPYDFNAGTKADCNARAARLLYNSAGWAPWGG